MHYISVVHFFFTVLMDIFNMCVHVHMLASIEEDKLFGNLDEDEGKADDSEDSEESDDGKEEDSDSDDSEGTDGELSDNESKFHK